MLSVALTGCSFLYYSPGVQQEVTETTEVNVVPLNADAVALANASPYTPRKLPAVFSQVADVPNANSPGLESVAPYRQQQRPRSISTRLPEPKTPPPYRIGVGDIVMLATPDSQNVVYEINGLLAAQSSRQGYTVQDDGAVAIPNVGRVVISGMTLAEAQNELFNKFVESQIEPSFSLEISEFRSQKISVDGSVRQPMLEPITLTPLYLDDAITAAGGIASSANSGPASIDLSTVAIKLYRGGETYQIPASTLFGKSGGPKVLLQDGDRVYVDDQYPLELAGGYLDQQIKLTDFYRSSLEEERSNFEAKMNLDAVDRDYVYRFGEVTKQGRFPLPFERTASLADVLFDDGGIDRITGDVRRIYVLRREPYGPKPDTVTAYALNAQNAPKLILATQFEMRPDDIVFVATHPISDWNRVISQLLPSFTVVGTTDRLFN
ncbi:polysaccharide biosynthesis/export family protein [Martelella endophytica]|uniref:polysaccharide biosynthesis/export family protein n=1 Tax=Martelella endophytica TaxID=1486262 RepID=UPI001FCDD29F|nr:polysaccharide biosynthesis/export family protein [Martelella endophytica]